MRTLFVLLILIFGFSKCKKEDKLNRPLNITLSDKTPKVIYSYIEGKWKFVYGKGGINSQQMYYCDTCTVEFTPEGKIISNTFFTANTFIDWQKEVGSNGDSTYIMHFLDHINMPNFFEMDKIFNDTLIYHTFGSDPVFFHFVKL